MNITAKLAFEGWHSMHAALDQYFVARYVKIGFHYLQFLCFKIALVKTMFKAIFYGFSSLNRNILFKVRIF